MISVCFAAKGGSGTTVVVASMGLQARCPTWLIDTAGDLPAVLGIADPDGPGLLDWLRSDAPPGRLNALALEVAPDVRLLPARHAWAGSERTLAGPGGVARRPARRRRRRRRHVATCRPDRDRRSHAARHPRLLPRTARRSAATHRGDGRGAGGRTGPGTRREGDRGRPRAAGRGDRARRPGGGASGRCRPAGGTPAGGHAASDAAGRRVSERIIDRVPKAHRCTIDSTSLATAHDVPTT